MLYLTDEFLVSIPSQRKKFLHFAVMACHRFLYVQCSLLDPVGNTALINVKQWPMHLLAVTGKVILHELYSKHK